jgi:hypothetical protein
MLSRDDALKVFAAQKTAVAVQISLEQDFSAPVVPVKRCGNRAM